MNGKHIIGRRADRFLFWLGVVATALPAGPTIQKLPWLVLFVWNALGIAGVLLFYEATRE